MRTIWYRSAAAAVVTAVTLSLSSAPATTASATEIKVLSTTNMFPTLDALRSTFETTSGHTLKIDHGGAAPVKSRIEGGEVADVAIHSRWALDDLAKGGKIKPGSTADVAHIPVGLAVREGARKPDVGSIEMLKRALLGAQSIAYPDPAGGSLGGIYFARLIEELGIAAEIKPKAKLTSGATAAAELVAKGGAELVVDQIFQLNQVKGLDLAALPAELKPRIAMSAGVPVSAREAQPGATLIKFLASPAAAPVIKARGMEP